MKIERISIRNFRRLEDVNIGIEAQDTVFVGPNNSGKTSATAIFRCFLGQRSFRIHDFSVSKIAAIDAFVNGLPLVVIELKKPGVPARVAFDENLTHYKQQIPALFWFNALLIASNDTDSRVGSLTPDWERIFE
jgi:predicted ATP-dependent endonuclease of OLD family